MKRIILLLTILFQSVCISAQSEPGGSCDKWNIIPYLYNDSISRQSEVCFWQNYWYEIDSTTNFYFPDTMIVCLHLVPSTELWEVDMSNPGAGRIISNLHLIIGENTDSYNIVNPQKTDSLLLIDNTIDFKAAFDHINRNIEGFVNVATVRIPMKEWLSSMNVFTNVWGEEVKWEDGKVSMLNSVIIETAIYDSEGNPCRRFEFSLPVNGSYCGNH